MMYDCIIVGGGIAGIQAAIQLGRYQHQTLVIDSGYGRSTLCRRYHNLLGWPDGVSGEHLRSLGIKQAKDLGVTFIQDLIVKAQTSQQAFVMQGKTGKEYKSKRLLLSTGVMDRIPEDLHSLVPCLGLSVFICPDCDGYEIRNKHAVVLGAGNTGARMALTLTYWTKEITYINHEKKPVDLEYRKQMDEKGIRLINERIKTMDIVNGHELIKLRLETEEVIHTEGTFIAFGGNEVKTDLAAQLGVERLENKHILVDPRTKMTNIQHIWAAGDIVAHSEQVSIAMGEGAQAAIWIHKSLLKEK